ncbi:hypothetical protein GCM10022223_15900 [Kineosporia mesophila]|uniref:DUF1990 domain-containing protein n=1 Tax=Kineosporia mesophila TaxID=566012 RepID=A0ABP6Z7Q0_9ACTN|nr:hypothetical protein [Kineosporia mesophila]MCD5354882.1 hypothetical protein [Kineosporia mesophila]
MRAHEWLSQGSGSWLHTRAPRGRWRLLFPVVLVAQRVYRRRYARALREPLTGGR